MAERENFVQRVCCGDWPRPRAPYNRRKCYECGRAPGITMLRVAGLCLATAAAIAAAWWWLGQPVALPSAAADPGRIPCVSYAPFRADQSPLVATTHVDAVQIEDDLSKLARLTNCVRTYSIENGLDQVPPVAA